MGGGGQVNHRQPAVLWLPADCVVLFLPAAEAVKSSIGRRYEDFRLSIAVKIRNHRCQDFRAEFDGPQDPALIAGLLECVQLAVS